jgi:hydroxypyruvate isomerase
LPKFAANLSMMFAEHAFLDRFDAAAEAGFAAVEFLFPYDHPPEAIAERLERNRLTQALFNLPPGRWDEGERGLAAHQSHARPYDGRQRLTFRRGG